MSLTYGSVPATRVTGTASQSQPAVTGGTIIRGVNNTGTVFAINPRHPDTQLLRTHLSHLKLALNNETKSSLESTVLSCPDRISEMDADFLPLLIARANNEQPDRNIYLAKNPALLGDLLIQLKNKGVESARMIVNCADDATHFAVFDYSLKDGVASVVGIEPVSFKNEGPYRLADAVGSFLCSKVPDVTFTMIESDLQRSDSECAMYILALAKKMHKEQVHFAKLHDMNRQDTLYSLRGEGEGSFSFIPANEADQYLPASMIKHAQSPKRPSLFLQQNPDAADKPVNKRNETLSDRQQRYLVKAKKGDKEISFSNSIFHKRRTEVERAIRWKESNRTTPDMQANISISSEEETAIRHYDLSEATRYGLIEKRRQLQSIEQHIVTPVATDRVNKIQVFLASIDNLPSGKHIRLGLAEDGSLKRIQGLMGRLYSYFSSDRIKEINRVKEIFNSRTNRITVQSIREKCEIFIENQQKEQA